MKDKLDLVKQALPELQEEYSELDKLFDEAFKRIFYGQQTEFDGKFGNLAVKLEQTIAYILDVFKEAE